MKKLVSGLAAAILLTVPARAANDTATIRLVAIVPVQCTLDVVGAAVQQRQLVLDVKRTCNTSHELTVRGQGDAALGTLQIALNGAPRASGHSAAIYQPEGYYDRVDRITIEATQGSAMDLVRFAGTLQLSVNPS